MWLNNGSDVFIRQEREMLYSYLVGIFNMEGNVAHINNINSSLLTCYDATFRNNLRRSLRLTELSRKICTRKISALFAFTSLCWLLLWLVLRRTSWNRSENSEEFAQAFRDFLNVSHLYRFNLFKISNTESWKQRNLIKPSQKKCNRRFWAVNAKNEWNDIWRS